MHATLIAAPVPMPPRHAPADPQAATLCVCNPELGYVCLAHRAAAPVDDTLARFREADGADLAAAQLEGAVDEIAQLVCKLPETSALHTIGKGVVLLDRAVAELRASIDRELPARVERITASVEGLLAREIL